MTAWWKSLGSPELTPEVQKKLIDSVHAEVGSRTIEELEAERETKFCSASSNRAPNIRRRSRPAESRRSNEAAAGLSRPEQR
jgi:hypothetical protein